MDLVGLVMKLVRRLWPFATVMWQDWGIQGMVALSLFAQIFLAIFGHRRKYKTSLLIRFLVWAAYLLSAYVATIALGKLTVVQVEDPTNPGYHAELLGLLAPVLLIHLGNPNSITAYSIEDNRLGFRQFVNIAATVGFVVWVLIRCWVDNSPVSKLFFPLFLAGLATSIGWLWCLDSVYRENSSVTIEDMDFRDEYESFYDEEKAQERISNVPQKKILQAFFRFDCLKPHIANWLYHPDYITLEQTKIDEQNVKLLFETTEIELSFMYDVLYTKAPILYTRLGIMGRSLVILCLASALSGFSVIFKSAFLLDMYIVYTYAMLIAVLTYELYQTALIPFSDWAVVKMIRVRRNLFMVRIISCVAGICINQRRWSNTIGQLNLNEYCRREEFWRPISTVLRCLGKEEAAKRHLACTFIVIPWFFKEMLHEYIMKLEEKREHQPFNKRGDWTLQEYNIGGDDILSGSIAQGFDKSIITWHITTGICLNELTDEDKNIDDDGYSSVKMISDYMMYLVALRPRLLSLTTTDVTMVYASEKLRRFLRYRTDSRAMEDLSGDRPLPSMEKRDDDKEIQETLITENWDVLSDARELAEKLRGMGALKWEVMKSMWVEMLCYAAYNCPLYQHTKTLRCGGELITHVWLILLHKTDKYQIKDIKKSKRRVDTPKNKDHRCLQFLCS